MKGFSKRLNEVQEYYFSQKLKEVNSLKTAGRPILNMGIGSPDLPPHPKVVKAICQAAINPIGHGYQGYQGIPKLREAFSNFYKEHYSVQLDPDGEILPLLGSKEGIMHVSMAFLDAGDQVLIPNPGYPTYSSVCKLLHVEPVYFDLLESLNSKLTVWEDSYAVLQERSEIICEAADSNLLHCTVELDADEAKNCKKLLHGNEVVLKRCSERVQTTRVLVQRMAATLGIPMDGQYEYHPDSQ